MYPEIVNPLKLHAKMWFPVSSRGAPYCARYLTFLHSRCIRRNAVSHCMGLGLLRKRLLNVNRLERVLLT